MKKTIFVTGGTGFIGTELCRACVAAGDEVLVLCRSERSARKAEALGATPVEGDLLEAGAWRERIATAAHVVHLAQPPVFGARVTTRRAEAYGWKAARMDANLLGALDPHRLQRLIYVSGTCYYGGGAGTALRDESATPRPAGIGRFTAESVDLVGCHLKEGLPIVTAFPGTVYGPGSWFQEYIFEPIAAHRRLFTWGERSPYVSPISVHDCARALLFLLEHGAAGERYFLVDDQAVLWSTMQSITAAVLDVAPRPARLPTWLVAAFMGRIGVDSLSFDSVLSNAKLKALGFSLRYPSVATGIPAVVAELREGATAAESAPRQRMAG